MNTARKRKRFFDGGTVVEFHDGTRHRIVCTPFDGKVIHRPVGGAFGGQSETPEAEFSSKVKRVVDRSRFDAR